MSEQRTIQIGPYPLLLPDFWHEPGTVREKPGFFGYNAVATPGVSFDLYAIAGVGDDPDERARLVDAHVRGMAPQRHEHDELRYEGVVFEHHRLEQCEALAPGAVYELYLTEAYGDLLHLGFGFTAPLEQEESLRLLFLTMVSGAIVRRGYALANEPGPDDPRPRRSWRDLFRRSR
jgi:hypothetical protein